MSDEEKEAIEQLKSWRDYIIKNKDKVNKANDIEFYLRTVLNLIQKQEKEIEDNKKYIVQLTDEQYRKLVDIIRGEISKEWRDKIKAKIEELENEKEKYFEKQVIQHEIDVLQSLLEKE